jgi:anti-anti-sigma factor
MSSAPGSAFHYEVEETVDANNYTTTTIKCHGKLISSNSPEIRELVAPLIQRGGKIILDFTDLEYLDSSGLGALVTLKVSSINRGLCVLELKNLTPRVKKLLSITNLLQLFGQSAS